MMLMLALLAFLGTLCPEESVTRAVPVFVYRVDRPSRRIERRETAQASSPAARNAETGTALRAFSLIAHPHFEANTRKKASSDRYTKIKIALGWIIHRNSPYGCPSATSRALILDGLAVSRHPNSGFDRFAGEARLDLGFYCPNAQSV